MICSVGQCGSPSSCTSASTSSLLVGAAVLACPEDEAPSSPPSGSGAAASFFRSADVFCFVIGFGDLPLGAMTR